LKKNYLYGFLRPFLSTLFKLWYHPTIIGKENIPKDGRLIIAGNHIHIFDPILVGSSMKRRMYSLAKKELFSSGFGFFFRAVGCIPIDRKSKNEEARRISEECLNDENVLYIAPEGTRNKTDKILLDFKYGAVSLAKKTNTKIVPYAVTGDYKFRSKNLKIVFSEPLDFSNETIQKSNEILYDKVKTMILENK